MNLEFNYEHAVVARVVDGDTIDVQIDLGFHVFTTQRFRLARINAPEMNTEQGKVSKLWLSSILEGKPCRLVSKKIDSYGRYIAEIYLLNIKDTEYCVNDDLVVKGYASYQKY